MYRIQINNRIKSPQLTGLGIHSFNDLVLACRKTKRLMNEQRAIQQLGYRSVLAFEQHILTLPADQRPQKELHDFLQKS
jgi:hypothetical protein